MKGHHCAFLVMGVFSAGEREASGKGWGSEWAVKWTSGSAIALRCPQKPTTPSCESMEGEGEGVTEVLSLRSPLVSFYA